MNKIRVLLMVVFGISSLMLAQDNKNGVNLNGSANIGVTSQYGDNAIGGSANGESAGAYTVHNSHKGQGAASADGAAGSDGTITNNSFAVKSGSNVSSSGMARGGSNVETAKGDGSQNSYGSLGDLNQNGLSVGSVSGDTYNAKGVAPHDPTVSGSGGAHGQSSGVLTSGLNSNSATVKTSDASTAQICFQGYDAKFTGNVGVSGKGGVGAVSTVGGGSSPAYGGAVISGDATYLGSGKQYAQGNLAVQGTTSANVDPKTGTVTSKAQTSSSAGVTNKH